MLFVDFSVIDTTYILFVHSYFIIISALAPVINKGLLKKKSIVYKLGFSCYSIKAVYILSTKQVPIFE